MSQIWMFTGNRELIPKKALKEMLKANDCHKWQIGFEVGDDGYRHYQGRLVASNDDYFEWCKAHIPSLHVEPSDRWIDYENKEGYYISSDDFNEMREVRFGTLRQNQKEKVNWLKYQTVREIDFWYDPKGLSGKSHMINYLWEHRLGHYVRPYNSTDKIVADVCSKMKKEKRKYILIDIPRVEDVKGDLIGALEIIKDGLVDDPRYEGTTINIRGVRVLVCTNSKITNLNKLS